MLTYQEASACPDTLGCGNRCLMMLPHIESHARFDLEQLVAIVVRYDTWNYRNLNRDSTAQSVNNGAT